MCENVDKITVDELFAGQRLDVFLFNEGKFESRNASSKAITAGVVLVGGKSVKKNYCLKEGDVITFVERVQKNDDSQVSIPLDIRFEDEHILVISKQADLLCHPSNEMQKRTLMHALIDRYGKSGLCMCQGNEARPGIIHRLDAFTTGLMICAKTNEAGNALIEQIKRREIDRRYVALVHGIVHDNTIKIDAPIRRHTTHRTKMVVGSGAGEKDAVTTAEKIETFSSTNNDSGYTLLECKLLTGRTHQIRVHMQFIKHPVVGDPLYDSYSPKAKSASLGLTRQFLHSAKLKFTHPITGETLEFQDNLPEDLHSSLELLGERVLEVTDLSRQYEGLL